MRALVPSVLVAASLVAGCDVLPNAGDTAPKLTQSVDGSAAHFVLEPWPFDHTVAFLCLHEPGDEFTTAHPEPAPGAQCVPLETETFGDLMTARFAIDQVPPALADAFGRSGAPWFFAISGSRGARAETRVIGLEASPIPSDAGPS